MKKVLKAWYIILLVYNLIFSIANNVYIYMCVYYIQYTHIWTILVQLSSPIPSHKIIRLTCLTYTRFVYLRLRYLLILGLFLKFILDWNCQKQWLRCWSTRCRYRRRLHPGVTSHSKKQGRPRTHQKLSGVPTSRHFRELGGLGTRRGWYIVTWVNHYRFDNKFFDRNVYVCVYRRVTIVFILI